MKKGLFAKNYRYKLIFFFDSELSLNLQYHTVTVLFSSDVPHKPRTRCIHYFFYIFFNFEMVDDLLLSFFSLMTCRVLKGGYIPNRIMNDKGERRQFFVITGFKLSIICFQTELYSG